MNNYSYKVWCAAVHEITESGTWLCDWTTTISSIFVNLFLHVFWPLCFSILKISKQIMCAKYIPFSEIADICSRSDSNLRIKIYWVSSHHLKNNIIYSHGFVYFLFILIAAIISIWIWRDFLVLRSFLVAHMVKNLPAVQEIHVWSLGREDPLEKGTAVAFLSGEFKA